MRAVRQRSGRRWARRRPPRPRRSRARPSPRRPFPRPARRRGCLLRRRDRQAQGTAVREPHLVRLALGRLFDLVEHEHGRPSAPTTSLPRAAWRSTVRASGSESALAACARSSATRASSRSRGRYAPEPERERRTCGDRGDGSEHGDGARPPVGDERDDGLRLGAPPPGMRHGARVAEPGPRLPSPSPRRPRSATAAPRASSDVASSSLARARSASSSASSAYPAISS